MTRSVFLVSFLAAGVYARRVATKQGEVASHSNAYAPLVRPWAIVVPPSVQMQGMRVGNLPQFDRHASGILMQAPEEYNPDLSDDWEADMLPDISIDRTRDNKEQPALGTFAEYAYADAENVSRVALVDTRSSKAEAALSPEALTAALQEECENDGAECLLDEPAAECFVRNQVDGPWADVWARYVLLRPGMSYTELKSATFQRNQLDPGKRIPGTFRTVVIAHAICFTAALPAVLTSDAVFPKLLEMATASRIASGI